MTRPKVPSNRLLPYICHPVGQLVQPLPTTVLVDANRRLSGAWREIVKDESPALGVADDCHIVDDGNRMRPIWRFPKIHRAFDAAGEPVEHDKFAVVSVHGE